MPVAEQRKTGQSKQNGSPGEGAATGHRHLLMPGNPSALPQIREIVVEAAERCGFDAEEVAKVEMAVGEACSNIIEHAYRTQPLRPEIEIDIQEFRNRLEITILDYS